MFYFIKTPDWIKKVFAKFTWSIPTEEKCIFLTFDDGPHPEITTFVLDELAKYNAKATFFCLGKNVKQYPDTYKRIIEEGHAVGNHTFNHLNGWKVNDKAYLDDIEQAMDFIDSNLFRPPYGRITPFQVRQLKAPRYNFKIIMWTVLSGDFDKDISADECLQNVILNTVAGSIVVFHDSEKAFDRISYALPGVLKYFSDKGYRFEKIDGVI